MTAANPHLTVVACPDLMLWSRIESQLSGPIARCTREEQVDTALAGRDPAGSAVVLVDVVAFPGLARRVREVDEGATIVGWAPHVAADAIEAAREDCDLVVSRGAIAQRAGEIIAEALET